MKKTAIFILALFLAAVLLCGCARQMEQLGDPAKAATRFSAVDSYGRFDIICDLDTGVMYAISENGTMTLLVNYDGSPRTFPGFDAKEDRQP